MPESKQISFKILVDERSAQQTKRLIGDIVREFTKLQQVAGSTLGGGGGGGFSVGGKPVSDQRLISGAQAGPKSTLAGALTENAKALKGLASVSRESMDVMSSGIARAVDQQKRSIASLDSDLAKLVKRYNELGERQRVAMANGLSPSRAAEIYGAKGDAIVAQKAGLLGQRAEALKTIDKLEAARASMGGGGGYVNDTGEPTNGSWRHPKYGMFRWGVAGGAVGGGVLAAANEFQRQPFDFTSASAKSAQALGTVGVATKMGDLRFLGALLQMRQDDKFRELLQVGSQKGSAGVVAGFKDVIAGIGKGDPNAPGNLARSYNMLDADMKGQIRQLIEQKVASEPDFQNKLSRVVGEGPMRVAMMRRMGLSEASLSKVEKAGAGNVQDLGELSGAFEAIRGGGAGFARSNMFTAARLARGGYDPGLGGLLAAAAPGGGAAALGKGLVGTGIDPVAAERIGAAMAGAMQGSAFGPTRGTGLLAAMTGVGLDDSSRGVYQAGLRGQALGGIGAMGAGAGDGLGAGINVLSAARLAGKDVYKANALSKLAGDPAALIAAMSGDLTPSMRAFGITAKDAKSMFSDVVGRNMRSRFVGGLAGDTPMGRAMRQLTGQYHGDVGAMVAKEGAGSLDALGAGLSSIMPQTFSSPAMAREAVAIMAGVGGKARRGRGRGDAAFGSIAGSIAGGIMKSRAEDYESGLSDPTMKEIARAAPAFKALGDSVGDLGSLGLNADQAAKSLANLTDAVVKLQGKLEGKSESAVRSLLGQTKQQAGAERETSQAASDAAARAKAASDYARANNLDVREARRH